MEVALQRWPVRVEIPVAWGDMDAFAHVNNTVYLRWFESARIEYFAGLRLFPEREVGRPRGVGPILASVSIHYRLPVTFPDQIAAEATVSRIGNTSFAMAFRLFSKARGALAAEGEGVNVLIDYRTGQKVAVDEKLRASIDSFEKGGRG